MKYAVEKDSNNRHRILALLGLDISTPEK